MKRARIEPQTTRKLKTIDLDVTKWELPDTLGLLDIGTDEILKKDCDAEVGDDHDTFKLLLNSDGMDLVNRRPFEPRGSGDEDYIWTDLETCRDTPKIDNPDAERRSLVIFWKPCQQAVTLPYGCSAGETINALSRWYVVDRAKPRLVELLCEQEANHVEYDDEEYCRDAFKPKIGEATKTVLAKIKARFKDIQGADSIFPPDLSPDERVEKLTKYAIVLWERKTRWKKMLLQSLAQKVGTDDRDKLMNMAAPQCYKHLFQEFRKEILDMERELELLASGKLRVHPFDSLFETLSDTEIVKTFKEHDDCEGSMHYQIEIERVGLNEKNCHGCEYRLAYPVGF